ncbi:kinase [Thraustotheca clavata]|uniref:Kinase n=1 Tax=Thraustotheca clavata TaxID=74557 RepID=A0A1W0AAZ4_9STRA|nr:kinase [Thraustotheca clavata]
MKNYLVERELASALYGQVLLCKHDADRVVIKRVDLQAATERRSLTGKISLSEDIVMEKQVHALLSSSKRPHKHIVLLHDTFVVDGFEHLVMEYCPNGELYDELQRQPHQRFSPSKAQDCFVQVVNAVAYIHKQGYAHGDLSLENVFLDNQRKCKLGDFGLAAPLHKTRFKGVGKLFYMAPEMFSTHGYDTGKADLWALGIMLFMMLTGFPLFQKAHSSDLVFAYVEAKGLEQVLQGWKVNHLFTPEVLDLLSKLLHVDPAKRLSMKKLIKHRYVRHGKKLYDDSHHIRDFFKNFLLHVTPKGWTS